MTVVPLYNLRRFISYSSSANNGFKYVPKWTGKHVFLMLDIYIYIYGLYFLVIMENKHLTIGIGALLRFPFSPKHFLKTQTKDPEQEEGWERHFRRARSYYGVVSRRWCSGRRHFRRSKGAISAPFQAFKRRRLGAVAGLLAGIPDWWHPWPTKRPRTCGNWLGWCEFWFLCFGPNRIKQTKPNPTHTPITTTLRHNQQTKSNSLK